MPAALREVQPPQPPDAPFGGHQYERRWWTLGVLCLRLLTIVIANASLNVALPTLAESLHVSLSSLQWIVDAYALVFAGLLLTAGSLGDRYGRRGALNVGLVIFGTASGLAVFANSTSQLIAARATMGVGAALVMPATLSILTHVFPPDERRRAIAIWAGFAGVGVALGGVISGWLLEHFWWGSIFLLNVLVVTVALVVGVFLVPHAADDHQPALDPLGALLSILGLGSLIYAIIEAPTHGWLAGGTVLAFAVALAVLAGFAAWELHADEPMLDLRFFTNPQFTAATTSITLMFFASFGMIFILTQYLQFVLGLGPLAAGIRLLPWAAMFMVVAPRSARLVERFGYRAVVTSGLAIAAGGLGLLAVNGVQANEALLALSLVVVASGMGMVTAPSTGAIIASLPLTKAGVGSAVNDTTRELGGALGVAVVGSVLVSIYRGGLPTSAGPARESLAAALQQAPALADAARHAFVHAFSLTLLVVVGVTVLASAAVHSLLRSPPHTAAATDEPAVSA
jgi:MFS transporter, DHA2 family, integral membrane protein